MRKTLIISIFILLSAAIVLWSAVPTTLNDFFFPGSQPNQSGNFETPDKCDNCHGGYDKAVEPAFGWRGSMMSQAARDPLFYASMTIANQDAPESGDLCIRCHSPSGWLEGNSTPTDGSALTSADRESVHCDFCHKMVKPTQIGVNPYPDDSAYTVETYDRDQIYLTTLTDIPETEADGMYIVDSDNGKRGPFVDADPNHQKFYSPFHSEAAICGTCHDVSNPAFSRDTADNYVPNTFDQPAPSFDPYDLFPVERTYSEWLMSDYNSPSGVYAPQFGGNKDTVSTCQDCHMADTTGKGCNKAQAPIRDDLPLHDMTGGNTFVPQLIESVFPGEADLEALDSGIVRARRMLQMAATMDVTATPEDTYFDVNVHIINETGHKLPSGYPEGRRIWINVQAYNSNDDLIYESGAYDLDSGILTLDVDAKIYEIKPGISGSLSPVVGIDADPSFHFVLNDTIYKDNRIPPRGFTNADFEMIQSQPVGYSYPDGQYWDDTEYQIPGATAKLVVNLYYQTTSKEYVEFLRDENITDEWGNTMYNLWDTYGRSAPELMNTDTLLLSPLAGNEPPVLDSIGPKSVDEGSNLNFTVTASDPDGTIPDLTTSTLPDGAGFTDHDDGTGTFDWTPTFDQADIYSVIFYATDDSAAVDSEVVEITVINVNRAPVLGSIGDKTVAEDDTLIIEISATDPDNDSLAFSADPIPANATLEDHYDNTATFTFIPDFSQAGEYSITFTVYDADSTDSELITITVTNTNRAPILAEIGSQNIGVDQNLNFGVSASDPDNDSIILSTSTLPDNAGFTDNGDGTGVFDWTPSSAQVGTHYVTFYAEDTLEAVDSEIVEITVFEGNQPPVLDPIGDKTGVVDQLLTFEITSSDPNGDSVALSYENLPDGATFTENGYDDQLGKYTATFSWTPGDQHEGVHENIHFIADDGILTDDEYISITIEASYTCGDANSDGLVNVSDAVWIINYVFIGGDPPNPLAAGEVNCDSSVNVSDAVWIVNYVFIGGNQPCDTNGDGIPDC